MGSKNKCFNFRLWIKDKESEEIIELSKNDWLKIEWEGGLGKVEKGIIFRKNGKSYRILVKILLGKYLLGMRDVVLEWKFLILPNSPYEVYRGYMGEPNNSPKKDEERQGEGVILINQWNRGRIVIFLTIIAIIVIFVSWMFRKKKEPKKNLLSNN